MPSTPYAKLLISVNGGAPTSGAITANPGDTIQFSAESTAQWDLTTPPRWEIYAYPPGWTGPASGWTTESVPQPGGGSADVYVYLGIGPPPAFTLPALPMWGKFLPKLTVAGGLLNGVPSAQLVDKSSGLQTIGPNGLLDVAVSEEGQFDSARAWVGPLQDDLRLLDAALAGSASPYASTPEVADASAGSAGVVNQYARGDHVHQVAVAAPVAVGTANAAGSSDSLARADHVHETPFSAVNNALSLASAPITVNGQTFTSGGNIAPYFASSAANTASTGLLRAPASSDAVVFRDSTNLGDLVAVSADGADNLTLGGSAWQSLSLVTDTNQPLRFVHGAAMVFSWTVAGIVFDRTATISVTQDSAPAGDGTAIHIEAQTAAAGAGGDVEIVVGSGATSAGDLFLDLGLVGTTSGFWYVQAGSASIVLTGRYDDSTKEFSFSSAASVKYKLTGDNGVDIFGGNASSLVNVNDTAYITTNVVSLFGAATTTGDKVLQIHNAETPPTAAAAASTQVWSEADAGLRALSEDNVEHCVVASLDAGTGTGEILLAHDRKAARVQTTNETPTTAITYALPSTGLGRFTIEVVARSTGAVCSSWRFERTFRRDGGGAATALGSAPTQTRENDLAAASWAASISASGNNAIIQVTGAGATTIEWFVSTNVLVFGPA